jgi:Tol biopolymer transport system component
MLSSGEIAQRPSRRTPLLLGTAVGILLVFAVAAVWLVRTRRNEAPVAARLKLRQLTQDGGLTSTPAISPDGKLISYASDRAGDAGLDIWVQQLSGGARPIRLTKDPANEEQPSFSPDGGQIVFAREGGGIYVIPSLGGEERLLMRGPLWRPRFSPDGQWVAAETPTSLGKVFIIPAAGGAPRVLPGSFYAVHSPIWSPDGKKLLIMASQKMDSSLDWWVVPLDGSAPVETGAMAVLQKFHPAGISPDGLEWMDDYFLYTDGNLWRIRLSADTGDTRRLTGFYRRWFRRYRQRSQRMYKRPMSPESQRTIVQTSRSRF